MKLNRKDKNISLHIVEDVFDASLPAKSVGYGAHETVLLIVEGETEEEYFNGLKSNALFKFHLLGLTIYKSNSLLSSVEYCIKNKGKYDRIFIVTDNDKRNAYILSDTCIDRLKQKLPKIIFEKIIQYKESSGGEYFLSAYDYMKWLSNAIGDRDTIEYWDIISKITTKNVDFKKYMDYNPYSLFLKGDIFYSKESGKFKPIDINKANKFDIDWKKYVSLCYVSIAFEAWLLLHFEKCTKPFLYVDKAYPVDVDIATYIREKYRPDYEKGRGKCNAYTSLFNDYKKFETLDDLWEVVFKIIRACKNAVALRSDMTKKLAHQNNDFFELNPYVHGLDDMLRDILKIKLADEVIPYSDHELSFSFDRETNILLLTANVPKDKTCLINNTHKNNFEIICSTGKQYLPTEITTVRLELDNIGTIFYDIPAADANEMVLLFKNPIDSKNGVEFFVVL